MKNHLQYIEKPNPKGRLSSKYMDTNNCSFYKHSISMCEDIQ